MRAGDKKLGRKIPAVGWFGLEFRVYAFRPKAELQTFCKAAHPKNSACAGGKSVTILTNGIN
jgi:hypothetical protein